MNTYKKILLFILIATLSLSIIGCNKSEDFSENNTDLEKTEVKEVKDELIVSMGERIPHEFDPKKRWGMYNESHIIHSTLLQKTADLEIVNDLAKDHTISEDGKIWHFELRDDFKFSNGDTVTAQDVKFSYDMLREDGKHWDLGFIEKIEIPEEGKVDFYLVEPRSTFWAQLTEVPIVPHKYYDENYTNNPIGSGPYMVTQFDKDEQAIFEINPYWHGEEPHFKKWTWVCLDENTALAAAKAGEIDIFYSIPEFADEKIPGFKLIEIESNDVRGLSLPYVEPGKVTSADGYKVGNMVTSDPTIRKALNIGLNRQEIVDVVLNGHGEPAYSVIDGMPWWNPDTAIEDNRVDEANKLLEDNGWILNDNNIRKKGDLEATFDLYYPTNDKLRTNIAIAAAEQAKSLGININVVASNWDEMVTKAHEDALLYAGGRHHPNQFYQSHNPERAGHGWANITFYNNPKVLEYMNQAMNETDLKKANEYWKLAQWDGETGASTLGDLPNCWLVRFNHTYIGNEKINVGNQPMHTHGHDWALLHNIYEWTWEE